MQSSARPVHGGIRPAQLRALGLDPGDVVDFSASVSPLGPPGGLWEALRRVDLTAYPDPECLELREALANYHLTNIDRILVGNGSTELIHLLARAFIPPSEEGGSDFCLLLTPTYGEYAGACNLAGARIVEVVAKREARFAWDLSAAEDLILTRRPALVCVCNPNNPTGVYLQEQEVYGLAQAATKAGSILVLDEAYLNFVEKRWDALSLLDGETAQNVVLLRSMTKDFALTSLRLGYCLASPEVTASLAALQPDWSVNGLAQVAGLVALADGDYLPAARRAVTEAKAYLRSEFSKLGLQVLPSAANFILVSVGDAFSWRDGLMRQGVFVRDCTSFGLPDCIRVGIRAMPDCRRLVEAAKGFAG